MNQTTVIVKLLNGIYQLTKLNLNVTPDGIVAQPLTINNVPIFNKEGKVERRCQAYFYKKNKRNTWFYKEIETKKEDKTTFA